MAKKRRPNPSRDQQPATTPPDQSRAEKMLITPEMARRWLERNTNNRACARRDVAKLKAIITDEAWVLNGATITFCTDNILRDGQTRLKAIVEANMAVWSWVIRDLDDTDNVVFNSTDEGRKRTLGHLLGVAGYTNANQLAIAIHVVYDRYDAVDNLPTGFATNIGLSVLKDHPSIVESLAFVLSHSVVEFYSGGTAGGLHYVMAQKDQDAADHFWESFATGVFTTKTNPARLARDIVVANRNAKADNKLTATTLQALIIKAWNLLREGKTRKQLRWNSEVESFPEVI